MMKSYTFSTSCPRAGFELLQWSSNFGLITPLCRHGAPRTLSVTSDTVTHTFRFQDGDIPVDQIVKVARSLGTPPHQRIASTFRQVDEGGLS